MARFHGGLDNCKTEGERKVLKFFRDNLNDEYVLWGNNEILARRESGRLKAAELDAILYHREIGLILFSIKDYRASQISRITKSSIELNGSRGSENPYAGVRGQYYTLKSRLQEHSEFLDHYKRLTFWINIGVIFPFIGKREWIERLEIIGADSRNIDLRDPLVLFKDDFETSSVFKENARALRRFRDMLIFSPSWPSEPLSDPQIAYLDEVLGAPDNEADFVDRLANAPVVSDQNRHPVNLDEQQKIVAAGYLRKIYQSPGHLLIQGTAGSGKTIILLHMFAQIARDPEKKLLYVGRQSMLVENFKQNLELLGVDTSGPKHLLDTFHGFCRNVFGDAYRLLPMKGDYSAPTDEGISAYINEHLQEFPAEYDFVFIDEGHNLPDPWIRLLVNSAKGRQSGNVIYVEDFEQNIYGIERHFDKTGLLVRNSAELLMNYRNTWEISYFALNVTNKYKLVLTQSNRLAKSRRGPLPTVFLAETAKALAQQAIHHYDEWIKQGFAPQDIAIIYPRSDAILNSIIKTFLDKNVILAARKPYWLGREFSRSIMAFGEPGAEKAVSLVTTWSAQGSNYKCVIVIMGESMFSAATKAKQDSMHYISFTRPTHNLALLFPRQDEYYTKATSVLRCMQTDVST